MERSLDPCITEAQEWCVRIERHRKLASWNPRALLKFAGGLFDDRKRPSDADAEYERQWRAYLGAARQRCLEYRELRYCGTCHHAMHSFQSFCEKCSNATEPLPAAFAVEYASAEFPELVKTREDFDRLIS